MKISDFKLERYFARHEFRAKYILCASDCETFSVKDLLSAKEIFHLASLRLGYTESQGSLFLREEIAKLFRNVSPEQLIVSGTEEGIFIAMNALLDKGDKVVIQYPCYPSLFEIPKAIGCRIVKWEAEAVNNRWHWDVDFVRKNVDKNTRLIILTSPHNPTGHLFSRKEYQEIMDIARENRCYVFSDEMYRFLEYDRKDRLPIGSDLYEKCISLSGMSKTFGLAGLRIGWLSVREQNLLQKIVSFKDYTTICNNTLSEFVASRALKKKDMIVSRNLSIIKRNLRFLERFFSSHSGQFVWMKPHAGSICLVKMKFRGNSEDFCEDVVKKKGVMLMPSNKFDFGTRYFRIGFGRKNMPEALKVFEEYVDQELYFK